MKPIFNPTLTDRQSEAYLRLNTPAAEVDVLYGGAKGGGKSHFLCVWVFLWSCAIAERFGLKPSEHPLHVGWIGRKQAVDFTGTTLNTWRRIIPASEYEIRSGSGKDAKHILIRGCIAVDFGGLDRQENINKFNSAEYGFIAVDQAEETDIDDVSVLMGSRRLTIDGKPLKYKGLWTANPGNCWLKPRFLTNPGPHDYFVQALPNDNPYLPENYTETLTKAFGHRPELLAAYLHGKWDELDGADQIIKQRWVEEAVNRHVVEHEQRELLACDVARFGDDETVIYFMRNTEIIEAKMFGQKDTEYTANMLHILSVEHNRCPVAIDDCPIAAGVIDKLKAMGTRVIPVNSASKPQQETSAVRFYNVRAEMWWNAARLFSQKQIRMTHQDPVLIRQLTAPTYKYRNGKILVEPKESIKERLGESTDRADAFLIGLYALPKVPAVTQDYIARHDNQRGVYVPDSILIAGVA